VYRQGEGVSHIGPRGILTEWDLPLENRLVSIAHQKVGVILTKRGDGLGGVLPQTLLIWVVISVTVRQSHLVSMKSDLWA
jgi:hypothetical protein